MAVAAFLLRGHTKNDCDRIFNLMKSVHRQTNTYTPQDLIDCINSNSKVVCVPVQDGDFKDFASVTDKYLSSLPKILDKHVFTVKAADKHNIHIQLADGEEVKKHSAVKKYCSSKQELGIPLLV